MSQLSVTPCVPAMNRSAASSVSPCFVDMVYKTALCLGTYCRESGSGTFRVAEVLHLCAEHAARLAAILCHVGIIVLLSMHADFSIPDPPPLDSLLVRTCRANVLPVPSSLATFLCLVCLQHLKTLKS